MPIPQNEGIDDWSDDDQEYVEELISEGEFDEDYEAQLDEHHGGESSPDDDSPDLGPADDSEYNYQDD